MYDGLRILSSQADSRESAGVDFNHHTFAVLHWRAGAESRAQAYCGRTTMTISDARLDQLANDPMMCNISPEVQEALRELIEARSRIIGLRAKIRLKTETIRKWKEYANV